MRLCEPGVRGLERAIGFWPDRAAVLAHVAELTRSGRIAMVQPYAASVDRAGETAMLFLGGRFSHAVRKGPLLQPGEGVRQDRDSRGDLRPVEATGAQRDVAQAVFDAIGPLVPGAAAPLYARIDLVEDAAGRPVVLELELAEPSLFLPQVPDAAGTFARAVAAVIQG